MSGYRIPSGIAAAVIVFEPGSRVVGCVSVLIGTDEGKCVVVKPELLNEQRQVVEQSLRLRGCPIFHHTSM
ncbi:hypothetical protein D9M71_751900 [compost metagenome]